MTTPLTATLPPVPPVLRGLDASYPASAATRPRRAGAAGPPTPDGRRTRRRALGSAAVAIGLAWGLAWAGQAAAQGIAGGAATVDPDAIELDCVIEAHEIVDLSSGFISGILETVQVDRGDVVTKDQVVAQLESRLERAAVDLAQAKADAVATLHYSEADREYRQRVRDRAVAVFDQGVSSVEAKDEAEYQLQFARLRLLQAQEQRKEAELELRRAQEALEQRTLHSPIDGIVVDRLVSQGEFVGDGAVLRLAQIDPLNVEVIVPVAWYGAIGMGSRGVVIPEEPVGGEHPATVTVVDRVVDAASGTFGVRLELPNPDLGLPAGLKCRVRFQRQ